MIEDILFSNRELMKDMIEQTTYESLFSFFMNVQAYHFGKSRWCNHAPKDIFDIEDILSLYPNAKFVICLRDIRDFILLAVIILLLGFVILKAAAARAEYYSAFFNVPANTPQETIATEFYTVFCGLDAEENPVKCIDIPAGGIIPSSHVGQGRHIVHIITPFSYAMTDTLLTGSGKNWQIWGFQTMYNRIAAHCSEEQYTTQEDCETALETWIPAAPVVDVPINRSVLNFLNDRYTYDENGNITGTQTKAENWTHKYAGQADHVFAAQ